jgi:large subunit ribosomal protein L22
MTRVKAQSKWLRIGPRKLSRVLEIVRGKLALEALTLLKFMPQKGARIIEKTLKSAIANAKNNYKMDEAELIVTEAFANKAIIMRRFQPRARGRAFPINKRTSHLTVWVGQPSDRPNAKKVKTATQPKEEA